MAQINFAKGEVQCKVVYYGPAESGKTENLRAIFAGTPDSVRGQLTTIATDANRTLFFDFLPLNLGKVATIRTKINVYAVPYIEGHDALRVLVLEGADGIVFVADARKEKLEANRVALSNLKSDLAKIGRDIEEIPFVFQANKMDLEGAIDAKRLAGALGLEFASALDARADARVGTMTTLKAISGAVLNRVSGMMNAPGARAAVQADATKSAPSLAPAPAPTPPPTPEPTPAPEPVMEIEDEEPTGRPAWHRSAPDETSTGTASYAQSIPRQGARAHAPIEGITRSSDFVEPTDDVSGAPSTESPTPQSKESATNPAEFMAGLKQSMQEAEKPKQSLEEPGTDPFTRATGKPHPFPAFGGGMATTDAKTAAGEDWDRDAEVDRGGTRERVRSQPTSELKWGFEEETERRPRRTVTTTQERRGKLRAQWRATPPPPSRLVMGATTMLVWLVATGFMVHKFL